MYILGKHCKSHDNERETSEKMANYPNPEALVFNPVNIFIYFLI